MGYDIKKKVGTVYESLQSGGDVFCTFVENDTKFYPQISEKSTMPAEVKCPYPKVNHIIFKWNVSQNIVVFSFKG